MTAVLAAVNGVLGTALVAVGRRRNALVLVANGTHVLSDMWTSVGVVAGVALVWLTGWLWIDPVVAMLAGANILYSAVSLLRGAFNGLLDQASPGDSELLVRRLQEAVGGGEGGRFHSSATARPTVSLDRGACAAAGRPAPGDGHRRITRLEDDLRALFPRGDLHHHASGATHAHDDHPDGHEPLKPPSTPFPRDSVPVPARSVILPYSENTVYYPDVKGNVKVRQPWTSNEINVLYKQALQLVKVASMPRVWPS